MEAVTSKRNTKYETSQFHIMINSPVNLFKIIVLGTKISKSANRYEKKNISNKIMAVSSLSY